MFEPEAEKKNLGTTADDCPEEGRSAIFRSDADAPPNAQRRTFLATSAATLAGRVDREK